MDALGPSNQREREGENWQADGKKKKTDLKIIRHVGLAQHRKAQWELR